MTNDKAFMPAQPFTYKVYGYINEKAEPAFYKAPIIAWRLADETYGSSDCNVHLFAFPIVPSDDGNAWEPQANEAILYPCGIVINPNGGTYESTDEWMSLNSDHFQKYS